jgi:hypothetical protein
MPIWIIVSKSDVCVKGFNMYYISCDPLSSNECSKIIQFILYLDLNIIASY